MPPLAAAIAAPPPSSSPATSGAAVASTATTATVVVHGDAAGYRTSATVVLEDGNAGGVGDVAGATTTTTAPTVDAGGAAVDFPTTSVAVLAAGVVVCPLGCTPGGARGTFGCITGVRRVCCGHAPVGRMPVQHCVLSGRRRGSACVCARACVGRGRSGGVRRLSLYHPLCVGRRACDGVRERKAYDCSPRWYG